MNDYRIRFEEWFAGRLLCGPARVYRIRRKYEQEYKKEG